jgi:hypothetical protein
LNRWERRRREWQNPPRPGRLITADASGDRRQGLFYGGCAVATLVALMAILVLGALIFLVASRSSEPSRGAGPESTPTPKSTPTPRSTPTPESTPHPGLREPENLNDVVLGQVGPFMLDTWEWETANAKAAGAIDGVGMSYVHLDDGTELVVSIWEWPSPDDANEDLNRLVEAAKSNGYQTAAEFTVEGGEGEQVGQAVHLHEGGQPELVVWTNGVLRIAAQSSYEFNLQRFYQYSPY